MVAFAVVVHTYYCLLVDANAIILEGDLRPPERCFLVGKDGRLFIHTQRVPHSPVCSFHKMV